MGFITEYNVTIIETPIKKIEIEDCEIIEFSNNYYFNDERYNIYSHDLTGTITLKSGETLPVNESIQIGNSWYSTDIDTSSQDDEPWTAGNTYQATASIMGVSTTFNVTITESPVASFTLVEDSALLYEGIDGGNMSEGRYDHYNVYPTLFEVVLKDGSLGEISEYGEFIYNGKYYYVYTNMSNMQWDKQWTPGNTYEATAYLLGASCSYNVTIEENPVENIELVKTPQQTEYLIGESVNLKGAVIRVNYTKGDYEEITFKDDFTSFHEMSIFFEKIRRSEFVNLMDDTKNPDEPIATINLFNYKLEIPVTLKENLMESISIREETDKSLIITVHNSDNTSYDMKVLSFGQIYWYDEGEFFTNLLTDKGEFEAMIFADENSFRIGLGDYFEDYGRTYAESNAIASSEFFDIACKFTPCMSTLYWLLDENFELQHYKGIITEENIDEIIEISLTLEGGYWEDQVIEGEVIKKAVLDNFTVTSIDLSMSELYDPSTDTYEFTNSFMGLGEIVKACHDKISYNNGIWSIETSVPKYDEDDKTVIYYEIDSDGKIIGFDINLRSIVIPIKNDWVLENGKWAFYVNDVKLKNCWKEDSTGWCYLGADGYMMTNTWVMDSVGWCYVGANGYCVTNTWKQDSIGWCYLDSNGRMATNRWIKDSVGWCYVGANGYCVTNTWKQDSIGWCYLDANGRMATDRWVMDSVGWCYVGANGYAVTNCWKQDNVGWCYLNSAGSMIKSDWVLDGGKWYYLDANGYMVTGWKLIRGAWYNFASSGVWLA